MANFVKEYKGSTGLTVRHTSTGYEADANVPANRHEGHPQVRFFARRAVADNGHPYTEIGLSGLAGDEKQSARTRIRASLNNQGYEEVSNAIERQGANRFYEAESAVIDEVIFCVTPEQNTISPVVGAMDEYILDEEVKHFIESQERIPDVMYQALFEDMGEELKRGPGGEKMAKERARELADYFTNGVW